MTNSDLHIPLFGEYYISPVSVDDADATYKAFIRTEITQNLAGPPTEDYQKQDAIDFLSSAEEKNSESPYPIIWGIRDRSITTPSLIGCIDIRPSDLVDGKDHIPNPDLQEKYAIFGFWLDTNYRQKGITSAALKALIYEVGVKQYGIKYFYGNCFAGNIASRKTFEKNGFKFVQFVKDGAVKLAPYALRDEERFELIL